MSPELPLNASDSDKSKKTRATGFENRIKMFFEKLQFDDVDGARDTFMVGGIQVDVCAGHEDSLIVSECTMRLDPGEANLRAKILRFRGSIEAWEKGFRNDPKYKKYKYFYYILAVRNIDVRPEDIRLANDGGKRIYIFNENLISYYEDLYKKIGHYAKYNLLGELGVRPQVQSSLQIPASLVTNGKSQMYLFFVNPRTLLEVAYVARREASNERYYQRIIDGSKLKKIAQYVNNGGVLPNNIIIAFGEKLKKYVKFHEIAPTYGVKQQLDQYGVKHGILEFPRDYRSCWVIDGQHRLYSFINVDKLVSVPVIAFKDLDLEQQCKIFLDINKNQKPVPSDLVWDLNGDMIPSEPDGIVSNVVKALNESGPLKYQIYIPSKGLKTRGGLLKIGGLCTALKKVRLAHEITLSKTANTFYSKSADDMQRKITYALCQYFGVIKELFHEDWILMDKGFVLSDGGMSVLIKVFEKTISHFKDKGAPSEIDYRKIISALARSYNQEDLIGFKSRTSGEGGRDQLLKEFILKIREVTGDISYGGNVEQLGAKDALELERRLKAYIKYKLEDRDDPDWLQQHVHDKAAYGKLIKHAQQNRVGQAGLYLQLSLGQCFQILREKKSDLYADFVGAESHLFHSDQDFEAAINVVTRLRNAKDAHFTGAVKREYDQDLYQIYLKKISNCLLKSGLNDDEAPADEDDEEEDS